MLCRVVCFAAHAYIHTYRGRNRPVDRPIEATTLIARAHQHTHEPQTGKKRRTDDLTIEEQVERFPFLKDAPLEGGKCVHPFPLPPHLPLLCVRIGPVEIEIVPPP